MITEAEDQARNDEMLTYAAIKEYFKGSATKHDGLLAATEKLGETVGERQAALMARAVIFLEHLMQACHVIKLNVGPVGLAMEGIIINEAMSLLFASGFKRADLHTLLVAAKSDSQEQDLERAKRIIMPPGLGG